MARKSVSAPHLFRPVFVELSPQKYPLAAANMQSHLELMPWIARIGSSKTAFHRMDAESNWITLHHLRHRK